MSCQDISEMLLVNTVTKHTAMTTKGLLSHSPFILVLLLPLSIGKEVPILFDLYHIPQ